MIHIHPYIRYAQALLVVENQLESVSEITLEHIHAAIKSGLSAFCVELAEDFRQKKTVKYRFVGGKNDAKNYKFLAPNIISSDIQASKLYKSAEDFLKDTKKLDKPCGGLTMSSMPIVGEFCSFSEKNVGRGKPSSSVYEQGLAIITSLTMLKPCLQDKISFSNVCIIPDISLEEMTDFIKLFKRMRIQQLESSLMYGRVNEKKEKFEPKRPKIFQGNFPNPPRSSSMGSIALLGAIGEMAKESEVSALAHRVLDSLKDAAFYMVQYGNASTYTYNHYVVDLAKNAQLKSIVDSIYYTELYREQRTQKSTEYQKFDLFTSRFLLLFNPSSFRDFLSFRGEYPNQIELLLITYFTKMVNIDPNIVSSAKILGRWLNQTAYFAAKNEVRNDNWEEIRKAKAKVLVELESSIFSAKSGDALIAQAVTRAGRLSNLDAPESASLFMEKTASGELELENAKNLLIAFSRIKNKKESESQPKEMTLKYGEGEYQDEDLNNI